MKTPHEILLAKHQAATPKLDAIRQSAVAAVHGRRSSSSSRAFIPTILQTLWRELIWPSRRIWAGLAAVWILIFIANLGMRDHPQVAMAKSPPSRQMIMAFLQQQLLTELIGPNDPPIAEPKKPYSPRPSSQRTVEIMTA